MKQSEVKEQNKPCFNDDAFTRAFILVSPEYRRWRRAKIVIPGINAPISVTPQQDYDATIDSFLAGTGRM